MANIPKYIACKHGDEKPDYLHPTLEPILKETFGIMVYQEQVMQIAQVLSGYSLGGADLLRRAMGKKNKEEMDAQRKTFVDGAVARGVDGEKASHIFDQVARFAEYGFNKSHAAAYALVAYQTAYMKANFPVEFIAASMSYDLNNTDKLNVFKGDLERMKFKLLPPDINKSGVFFTVENGVVRYALSAIKNVGEAAMKALFEERERNGPFKNLFDFAKRLDTKTVNRRQLENMVRAGVFDSLDPNRAKLFEGIDVLIRHAQAATEERESNQTSLFGGGGGIKETSALKLAERPDWPHWERLKEENAAIGYYLSAHPMDAYTVSLQRLEVIRSDRIGARLASGLSGRVRLAGNVISKQERTSSRGSRFAFLNCSDAGGSFEVTLFSEVLAVARDLIESGKPLLISADAKLDGEQLRLTAQSVESLDEAAARTAAGLKIFLRDTSPLLAIRQLLAGEKKGRGHIFLIAQCPENEVEIKLKESYSLSPQALAAVKNIPGITEVREV
jgi:DNA polymerase-3 subunit alpha